MVMHTLVCSGSNNSCGGRDLLVVDTSNVVSPVTIATSNTRTHTEKDENHNDHPAKEGGGGQKGGERDRVVY